MIKLVVTDMDQTLNYFPESKGYNALEAKLCEHNIKTLKYLKENDIKFAVATGRLHGDVDKLLKKYDIEYYSIVQNGSFVCNENKEFITTNYHDEIEIKKIYQILNDLEITYACSDFDTHYFNNNMNKEFANKIFGLDIKKVYNDKRPTKITNICILGKNHQNLEQIKQLVSEKLKKENINLDLTITSEFTIDINPKNINKGDAIKYITDLFDIKKEEVFVVGDSFNDLSMFKNYENSFVMSHAHPDVLKEGKTMINLFGDIIYYL